MVCTTILLLTVFVALVAMVTVGRSIASIEGFERMIDGQAGLTNLPSASNNDER